MICEGEDAYRLTEDLSEEEQEDGAQEVGDADGNVEGVGLLVHVRSQDTDANEVDGLNYEQSNGLGSTAVLSEGNKHSLDQDIEQDWYDKVVRSRLELDVQKSPLVKRDRVRVENVGRVLVHGNAAAGESNDLAGSPAKDGEHGEDGEYCQDHLGARIASRELPEAEYNHLRETNEDDAEQDALEDSVPAISEILELFALHVASLDEQLTDELKEKHTKDGEHHEDQEKDVAGHEDVRDFDVRAEANTFNASDNDRGRRSGSGS